MKIYSFPLAGARLCYLLTITRVDGTIIRVTNYGQSITINSNTWLPEPGLEIGDYTETNSGKLPNLTFKVAMRDGGPFTKEDISNRLFELAEATLSLCDARHPSISDDDNPPVADEEIFGIMKGKISFDLDGNADFEFLNKFSLPRDVFVREYTIEDNVDFGDPRRSKIPTFPTVDETSDDLADV